MNEKKMHSIVKTGQGCLFDRQLMFMNFAAGGDADPMSVPIQMSQVGPQGPRLNSN